MTFYDGGTTYGATVSIVYDDSTFLISSITAVVAGADMAISVEAIDEPNGLDETWAAAGNSDGSQASYSWDISSFGSQFPSATKTNKGGLTVPDWSTVSFTLVCGTSSAPELSLRLGFSKGKVK